MREVAGAVPATPTRVKFFARTGKVFLSESARGRTLSAARDGKSVSSARRVRLLSPQLQIKLMTQYQNISRVIEQANLAWNHVESDNEVIRKSFEHLELVMRECQKTPCFQSFDKARKEDFSAALWAIVRCTFHYKILCQNGCFDDARFFLRKTMEHFTVATVIGYDDALYELWKNEEFTKPKKGFSYLARQILDSSKTPLEEKKMIQWMLGKNDFIPGPNQYHFLSEESIHGLSRRVLRSQIKGYGLFNLGINHAKSEWIYKKMLNVVSMLFAAANLALGVFKYEDHIRNTVITSQAKALSNNQIMLIKNLAPLVNATGPFSLLTP